MYGRVSSMLEVGTGFHGEMTGRENVYMNGAILGMTKEEIKEKLPKIIEFSEIEDFIDTPVKRYSSGMYIKLAFSVAAHLDSEIVIMDEVLAVGDMAFQKKCLDRMKELAERENKTVLYVSHNMETIKRLCSRCIVLNKGKVIFDGDVDKAIEIYIGEASDLKCFNEYNKDFHIENKNSFYNTGNKTYEIINSLNILEKNEPIFDVGEPAFLEIKCKSPIDIENAYFRIEVKDELNKPIGTIFVNEGFDIKANEDTKIKLKLDTSEFVPGRYRADLILFRFKNENVEAFIDGVYPAFYIEISPKFNEKNKLVWLKKYWGKVHLNDACIIEKGGAGQDE